MAKIGDLTPYLQIVTSDSLSDNPACWLTSNAFGDALGKENPFRQYGFVTKDSIEMVDDTDFLASIDPELPTKGLAIAILNRPGTGRFGSREGVGRRDLTPNYYDTLVARRAEKARRELGFCGLYPTFIFGDSTAAMHGASITAAEIFGIERLESYDTVGLVEVPEREEGKIFLDFTFKEEPQFLEEHPKPEINWYKPKGFRVVTGPVQMVVRQILDAGRNSQVIASSITRGNLERIRDDMPGVAVLVATPESTLGLHPAAVDTRRLIEHMRSGVAPDRAAEFVVTDPLPGRTHYSVNNDPSFRKSLIQDTFKLRCSSD